MKINRDTRPIESPLPGIAHTTLASQADGLTALSVWRQRMAPGSGTPPHRHDCDEVVLCVSGQGELHTEGRVQRFGPDSALILPAGCDHQFFNVGTTELETIGIFAATPVMTRQPDGAPLALPWAS